MMARAVMTFLVGGALALGACSKGEIRSGESQYCTTSSSEDPRYICDPGVDLICINTYGQVVTDPKEMRKWDGGVRPVWVCRLACMTDQDCPLGNDVCCPGQISGKTYGKMGGCVPPTNCAARADDQDAGVTPKPDAARDSAPPRPDAGTDTAPDAAPDAPADAPADAQEDGA